jgi:two-component system cell cycle response regulator
VKQHSTTTGATDAILVAEDDPISSRVLERMLRKLGYDVTCVGDGQEALETLQERDIRMVITDWMMPRIDGIELCRRIRAGERPGYVYVIVLTALDDTAHLVEALEAGADDYITKPLDPQELGVRVRSGQRVVDLDRKLGARASELETMAELLNSARYHMESVIESVGQGIVSVDNEGMIHTVNHEAGRLFADETGPMVGRYLHEAAGRFRVLSEFAFGPGPYPRSMHIRDRGLTIEVWASRIRPIETSPGLILTITDITERDRMQREIEEANRRLSELAVTDAMTGLANHRRFQEEISRHVNIAKRASRKLSLLMVDVDHFKHYNDTFGHPGGDKMLALVAQTIRAEVRETDVAARYGGEEFAVILIDAGVTDACDVAERIRGCVERSSGEVGPIAVTVSIGIAGFPDDGATPSELVMAADEALYAAKNAGRNAIRTSAEVRSDPGLSRAS